MSLTQLLALSLAVCALAWAFSWRLTVDRPTSPLGLLHLLFAATILWRPTLLLFGLDGLFPEQFHGAREFEFAARTLTISTLWLVTFDVAYLYSKRLGPILSKPFPSARSVDERLLERAAIALTVAATLATVGMWIRFGGPAELIEAAKFEKTVGFLLALRAFPVVATIINAAVGLHQLITVGDRRKAVTYFALSAFTAGLSFTWGARDSVVLVAIVLLFGPLSQRDFSARDWRRVVIGGVSVIGGIVLLRVARDLIAAPSLSPAIAGQSIWRQVSVAANLTQFDAFVLAVRDAGTRYSFSGVGEFTNGFLAAIPGLEPDQYQVTALRYAQEYEPTRANGRPLSSIGDWYFSLGIVGVAIGGLLSGLLYRGIATAYRSGTSASDFVIGTFVVLSIAQLGVWASIFIVYRSFFIPLILVIVALRLYSSRQPSLNETELVKGS